MSKNLTRKGLALATALTFGLTGLTATAPAYAAAGDVVSIEPTTGTGWGSYNTEAFSFSTKLADSVSNASAQKLAIELKNVNSDALDNLTVTNATIDSIVFTNADEDTHTLSTANSNAFANNGTADLAFTYGGVDYTTAVLNLSTDLVDANASANYVAADGVIVAFSSVGATSGTGATAYDKPVAIVATAFIDTDADNALTAKDATVSKTETLNFYDPSKVSISPRIERFANNGTAYLSDAGQNKVGFSLTFSPALNIEQTVAAAGNDLHATISVVRNGAAEAAAGDAETFLDTDGETEMGLDGRLYGYVTRTSGNIVAADKYKVSVWYGSETAKVTSSFTVAEQTSVTGKNIADVSAISVAPASSSKVDSTNIALRAGQKAFTFTGEGEDSNGDAVKRSNVPAYALVQANVVATGSSLTVGSKKLADGQTALVSGVTNASGNFDVAITSGLAKKGESFDVTFYVLDVDGTYQASSTYTATYEAAAPDAVAASSKILAGSSVSAKFVVEDQFGEGIGKTAAGTALVARLTKGSSTTYTYAPVSSSGAVTFAFANYVAKGDNSELTVEIGTGTGDDAWETESLTDSASLYNPEAAAEVIAATAIENQNITYDAFITGADSATNVAPTTNGFTYEGTVVDTTGSGIPGAVVTISAKGLQFQEDTATDDGDFYKDSITVAAGTDGAFHLNVWAHKVSSKGITITATSAGKSATTKLTTVQTDPITADDLVFTWDAPKHPATDVTYITTVKVTDSWGNPLKGAGVTFDASGAVLVNGVDTVDKTTSAAGLVRVYIRSLLGTKGIANISATLTSAVVGNTTLGSSDFENADSFVNVITEDIIVGASADAVAGKTAGTAKVTAYNAKGKTVTVYVAGKKVATKKATSSSYSFTVKAKAGAVVKVKVGTSTYFNAAVN